jgi:hypothetical protein
VVPDRNRTSGDQLQGAAPSHHPGQQQPKQQKGGGGGTPAPTKTNGKRQDSNAGSGTGKRVKTEKDLLKEKQGWLCLSVQSKKLPVFDKVTEEKRLCLGYSFLGRSCGADNCNHTDANSTVITAAAIVTAGTSADNGIIIDSDYDDTIEIIPSLAFPKNEHGLTVINSINIKNHLAHFKSVLSIVSVKPEPGAPNTRYLNGVHFLATVLTITEAPMSVMNLLTDIKNIGNRKDVRTDDIIGFLTTNGVNIVPLTNDYKTIMTMNHANPIIIEYSVTRHVFESKELPPSWLQFCLLLKKEQLLVPFNEIGTAINFGKQFNQQKWTKDFTHYYNNNLKYRIAPVDRSDKKGPKNYCLGPAFQQRMGYHYANPRSKAIIACTIPHYQISSDRKNRSTYRLTIQ